MNGQRERVLVDGGATHCLRKATAEEWQDAQEVMVHLATGSVKLRQHPTTKTILTKDSCQPIVPVSLLVQSGAHVAWDRDGCEIQHPAHGKLDVVMDQGCPTLDYEVGLKIMTEIEQMMKKGDFAIKMLGGVSRSEEDAQQLRRLQEIKKEFPEVPDGILHRIPGNPNYDSEKLPLNRKMRRRVKRAERIILHLYSGPNPKEWMKLRDDKTSTSCATTVTCWMII